MIRSETMTDDENSRVRQWIVDVRAMPRHLKLGMGDPTGDPLVVTLKDGKVHWGVSAVAPDADRFLLTTSSGSVANYYTSPDPSHVRIEYRQIGSARCGAATWPPA